MTKMNHTHHSHSQQIWSRRYTWLLLAVWTVIFAGLLAWNIHTTRQTTQDLALNEALTHLERDLTFRLWATSHGGVYVPTDERTPPNPYLAHIPERDIETPSGRRLTLMNPAYALRQMNEDFEELYGVYGHITSLDPLRPENKADAWEWAALQAFERGESESLAFTELDGATHLRLMQPLLVTENCLKCHAHQGYQIGDVRGGVSISVPMADYLSQERREIATHILSLGMLWMMGFVGINLGSRGLEQRIRERDQTRAEIERSRQRESVLNAILHTLIQDISLKEQLERALDTVLAIPWLPVRPQGGIFLVSDDPDVLELEVHQGLPPALLTTCDRVPFGKCLCGRAAASGEIEFADRVDERHETIYEGMQPHGHYCVPILSGGETVGIMTLYLEPGHPWDTREADFLQAVARALSGIIEHKRAEEGQRQALAVREKALAEASKATHALREAETRYRTVADFTYDWEYWEAPDGTMIYVSPACERITGYTPERFMGDPRFLQELILPPDRDAWAAHTHAVENLEPQQLQFRIRRRDGETRWIEHACQPVTDEQGLFLGYRASNRDVTKRAQAEAELSLYREHLEELVEARTVELAKANEALREANLVVESSPAVLFRWRAAEGWPVELVSENVAQFGYTPEQLLSGEIPYTSIVHPDDRERVTREVQEFSASGVDRFHQEYRIVTVDGDVRWTDDHTTIQRDAHGNITHYQGIVLDITERKQAEEALRASKEQFETAITRAPIPMVITDANQDIVLYNDKFIETFGYTLEDISTAEEWWIATYPDKAYRQKVRNSWEKAIVRAIECGGEIEMQEWDFTIKDRSVRRVEFKMTPLGEISLIAMNDITERVRAEQEIQRLYEQTQHDSETKATLLKEVNHRVSNNLASLIGILDLEQERTAVDPSTYHAVMGDLANRIRGLSIAHRMLSATEWSPPLLSELAERVIGSALQALPRDKRVSVEVSPSTLRVSPKHANNLALVLNELTTNSVKYAWSDRQSGRITVRIDQQEDMIIIEFRDDGKAYPKDVLSLERHSIGWELIQTIICHGMRGEVTLRNDQGAVTVLRYPAPIETNGRLTFSSPDDTIRADGDAMGSTGKE